MLFQATQNSNFMSESKFKEVLFFLPSKVHKKYQKLNNGNLLPMVTFGTSKIDGFENIHNSIKIALETGYRSFECEPEDNQEKYLGIALSDLLPKNNLTRSDIYIIGKVCPKFYGATKVREALERTCSNLQTDYLDLYLMQWPGGYHMNSDDEANLKMRRDTWMEMMTLNKKALIKSIGVCNFEIRHLKYFQELNLMPPAVNQCEFHPRCPQRELLNYCRENEIMLQAISFENSFHPLLLNDGTIRIIGRKINRTPTQVILRWILNHGVAVIPQSTKPKTIRSNFALYDFVLEKPEMDAVTLLKFREKYLINPISIV
ncbi:hypothetical protein RUM43_014037 [Polyplax serrata]|uniref:NADP-dependent oxidoreductase domain-containing protein n=1 Tax=Polyplax serrata TaxID=468196 RepID=A0AAN8NVS4_POLSC